MTNPKLLTVDEILACSDLEEKIISVPQWNGKVKIRSFTKDKQQQIYKQSTIADELETDSLTINLFINGVIEPQFDRNHFEQLKGKSAAAIDLVVNEIMRMSGITEEASKEADKNFRAE